MCGGEGKGRRETARVYRGERERGMELQLCVERRGGSDMKGWGGRVRR